MRHLYIAVIAALLLSCAAPEAENKTVVPTPTPTPAPVNEPDDPEEPDDPDDPDGPDDPVVEPEGTFYVDGTLCYEFATAPVLGTEGLIRIWKTSDGSLADSIDLADVAACTQLSDGQMVPSEQVTDESLMNTCFDALGPGSVNKRRIVHYTPIRINGNVLEIKPHSRALDYDAEYSITIDEGAVRGFSGVALGEWTVKTRKKPSSKTSVSVSPTSESADFRTIQGAVDYSFEAGSSSDFTISVGPGEYREMLYLPGRGNLTIKGEDKEGCILRCANAEEWMNGTGGSVSKVPATGTGIGKNGGRAVILMENCGKVRFENLTLVNSYGTKGQAEVIYNNDNAAAGLLVMENCDLESLQDTFLTKGYAWLHNCLIAGNCDFIWGYPKHCLFEDCEIRALAKGYIIQARCQSIDDKGFVFLNCSLTSGEGVADGAMTLGRSAGSSDLYDNVAYIDCTMGPVIPAKGWESSKTPNPSAATATAGWREYGSVRPDGTPIDLSGRYSGARVLTADEADALRSRPAGAK